MGRLLPALKADSLKEEALESRCAFSHDGVFFP